jgi:hypothetical protein
LLVFLCVRLYSQVFIVVRIFEQGGLGMAVPVPAVATEVGETWTAAIFLLYYNGR